jgi:hypothetical protein
VANSTEDDWDEASPSASGVVSQGDDEIRVLRASTRNRLEKEHVKPAGSNVGGEHLAGSAKAYSAATAPTKRPDSTNDAPGTTLDATDKGRLWFDETLLRLKRWDGSAWVVVGESYALLSYTVAAGNDGGNIVADTWTTRPLNTEDSDADGIVSLPGTNLFRLQAGRYRIVVRASVWLCGGHKLRVYNSTDASATLLGENHFAGSSNTLSDDSWAELRGEFVLTGQKDLRIEHNCETTNTGNGMGKHPTFTGNPTCVYMTVELRKLA